VPRCWANATALGFFQLIVQVLMKANLLTPTWYFSPQQDGWDPSAMRHSSITTALRSNHISGALTGTKPVPRQSGRSVTGYCHFCLLSCWCQPNLFKMAQKGWLRRGPALPHQRLEGERSTAEWESGVEAQLRKSINILPHLWKVSPCRFRSLWRKWVFLGHCPAKGGVKGGQLWRKHRSAGNCLWGEEACITVACALPSCAWLFRLFIS